MVKEISDDRCLLLTHRFLYNAITLAFFNLSANIPVIRDWFITIVRGFSRAGDINFSNFVNMPSCPEEFFVRKYAKVLAMWFSSTREKLKEVTIFLVRYLWWVSCDTLYTLLMRLGPMLIKNSRMVFFNVLLNVLSLFFSRWYLACDRFVQLSYLYSLLLAKIYNFWQVCSFVGVSVC